MRLFPIAASLVLTGAFGCSSSEFGGLTGKADNEKQEDAGEVATDSPDAKGKETIDEPEQVAGAFLVECAVVEPAAWTGDAAVLEYATLYGCGIFNSAEDKTKVADLVVKSAALDDKSELPFVTTDNPDIQLLIPVPNLKVPGGQLHIAYTHGSEPGEVVVSLGTEKPKGCALLKEESPKVLPVVMDLETFAERGLDDEAKGPLEIFKGSVTTAAAGRAVKMTKAEGKVIYDTHTGFGTVSKIEDCPFRARIAFKDAAGALVAGAGSELTNIMGKTEGLAMPAVGTTVWIGFVDDEGKYYDNEGVPALEGKPLKGSTGGCSFTFQLIECTP